MAKSKKVHFRVHTTKLLHEIVDHGLRENMGILKVPINTFKNLLAEVAQRCTELHDPVLDRLMFDLTLYELPETQDERIKIMKEVYAAEKKYLKSKKK